MVQRACITARHMSSFDLVYDKSNSSAESRRAAEIKVQAMLESERRHDPRAEIRDSRTRSAVKRGKIIRKTLGRVLDSLRTPPIYANVKRTPRMCEMRIFALRRENPKKHCRLNAGGSILFASLKSLFYILIVLI